MLVILFQRITRFWPSLNVYAKTQNFTSFRYIRSINRQNLTYKLAPNHLVDLTDEEYDGHGGMTEGSLVNLLNHYCGKAQIRLLLQKNNTSG